MSSKSRRPAKVRSSKKYCEEKFCCYGEQVEAEYECEECKSLQCLNCDTKLHELAKFVFHDRKRLQPAPSFRLCQLSCEDRNYADVRCENCALNYCNLCFERMHSSGKRKAHTKLQLTEALLQAQLIGKPATETNNQSSGEFFDALKPSSPTLSTEESLAYLSLGHEDSIDIIQEKESSTGDPQTSSIMSEKSDRSRTSLPDVTPEITNLDLGETSTTTAPIISTSPKNSLKTRDLTKRTSIDDEIYKDCHSFLLVDQQEKIQVSTEEAFIDKLGCESSSLVKVVSIFGNTGDGKSHTLNHTFFGGKEIFQTSATQSSCTVGVWAAYDPVHNAVMLDTEGLLGVTANQNQRTRLLLKVLAISDIVIYRTQADRLHNDMFHFLGDASKAYLRHFSAELKAASKRCKLDIPISNLGPAVVIYHETRHTNILGKEVGEEAAEMQLQRRCRELDVSVDAFSALQYVGTRTSRPPTDFTCLLIAVKAQLRNINVRSPRKPAVIFKALKVLNDKFTGDIEKSVPSTFPDQYFTCTAVCLSCSSRCTNTMNHTQDDVPHTAPQRCKYQHQYENKMFHCKVCYDRGQDILVVPKTAESSSSSWIGLASYAWSGYVLECCNCGIIYRSRQYWYGNQDPEKSVVRTEIRHVWPGGNPVLQGTHNAGRRLLDSLNYASETIGSISAKPAKIVSHWVTDQIAPSYWVPNAQITRCYACQVEFSDVIKIHHCRACGQGFCDECSSKMRPVPERGWGPDPVRVCDNCHMTQSTVFDDNYVRKGKKAGTKADERSMQPAETRARKVGEMIGSAVATMATVIDYPIDVLRESARPAYWVPDQDITHCHVCKTEFDRKLMKHHCRACGQGVCDDCSLVRRAVPSRGWDTPVRVCDDCDKKKGTL